MSYLFPLSFVLNTFSMTAFLIGLGLAGKSGMAADFGIVQGATLALFYAFSGNARNLALNQFSPVSVRSILVARLLLIVPLGCVAFYLSVYMAEAERALALILILRRSVEWVSELHLSEMELRGYQKDARKFLTLQLILFCLALGWTLSDAPMPLLGLSFWAVLPLLQSLGFIRKHLVEAGRFEMEWYRMLPHLGSTAVIGITVYVFRLLILLMVARETAGDLYAAFAIGGIPGSLFGNAFGPSFVFHESRTGRRYLPAALKIYLRIFFVAGVALFLASALKVAGLDWTSKSQIFLGATGLSMVGGVVMVAAQRIRLRLLQLSGGDDVFGPDVLMNILLVASVPYLYYLVGKDALIALYLFSAVLAFLFYFTSEKGFQLGHMPYGPSADSQRTVIAFLLLFPMFFQLTGNIFQDPSFVFDSQTSLKRLPLPLSILACYGGILLFGNYKRAYISLGAIFLSFILMFFTSIISTQGGIFGKPGKLLLLLQFVLPMFSFVLGQVYEQNGNSAYLFEKVFLSILAVIVPVQLIFTWLQGHFVLTPYFYLFSIYQHIQYVCVIFVCAYLISLYSLWHVPRYKKILLFLAPVMGIYATASVSMLALFALIGGVLGFVVYRWKLGSAKQLMVALLLVILAAAGYLPFAKNSFYFQQKFTFLGAELTPAVLQLRQEFHEGAELTPAELQLREEFAQTPIAKRLHYWKYYAKSIVSGSKVFLFGHAESPDRTKFPSAHNYYLDFVYNFGSLAVLPLVGVLGYMLVMVFRCREAILASPSFLGLTVVVLFLLLVDNSLKVGLRQPYPGIITFFLWGVLLSRLSLVSSSKSGPASTGCAA